MADIKVVQKKKDIKKINANENIIFGMDFDDSFENEIKAVVITTSKFP